MTPALNDIYPLVYLTANESKYFIDFKNIGSMLKFDPGVPKIALYVVVSLVRPHSKSDKFLKLAIEKILAGQERIQLKNLVFKENLGRDFSSGKIGLQLANNDCLLEKGYVFIRNRSAYGPFKHNWYLQYVNQSQIGENIGIIGNTLNFEGHPKFRSKKGPQKAPHIQTYLYLLKCEIAKKFLDNFPGENETDRLEIIQKGEIVLSKLIMEMGYSINCLYWPNLIINDYSSTTDDPDIVFEDVKSKVRNLPFIHRTGYTKFVGGLRRFYVSVNYVGLPALLYWNLFMMLQRLKKSED